MTIRRAWCVVFVTFIVAVAIRAEMISLNGTAHDEVISILFAQGNAGTYEEVKETLAGKWVPASEWKTFLQNPSPDFMAIDRDLSELDVHPPLYFWVLHFWIKAFGPEAARWLNMPFLLATTVALFFLARKNLSLTGSVLATSIWLLSPETVRITAITRAYEILALIAVLIAIQTTRIIEGRTDYRNIAALGVLAVVGMLTHYLAALVLLTAVGLIALRRRDALVPVLVAMIVASVVFVALHPGFYMQFGKHETVLGFVGRSQEAASTLLGFFGWRRPWTTPGLAYFVLAVVVAGGAIFTVRYRPLTIPLAFALFPAAMNLVAYLTTVTPSYAFLGRHLSFAWPFVAIVLSMAVYRTVPRIAPFLLALVILIVGPAEYLILHGRNAAPSVIGSAPQLVLNNLAMGILPRYLFEANDAATVFATTDLDANLQWLSDLRPGALVIINPQYQAPAKVQRARTAVQGLELISQEWSTTIYRR